MQIDLIDNSTVANFKKDLQVQMIRATHFDIATAFITKEALEVMDLFLTKNKSKNKIGRLLTGFYNCFNSKEVLFQLQALVNKHKGKLYVNVSREESFHWKYYAFKRPEQMTIYLGSSNFTESGMTNNGELLSRTGLNVKDKKSWQAYDDTFNRAWNNSLDISGIDLRKYKQATIPSTARGSLDPTLRKLLFSYQTDKTADSKALPGRVIFITSTFSAKTIKLLDQYQSGWDKNNWDCFNCYTKADYVLCQKAKVFLIIERFKGKYELKICDYKDHCFLKTTNEGNYFIAHKERKKKYRETNALRMMLEDMGINYHSRGFSDRNIGVRQAKKIIDFLSK